MKRSDLVQQIKGVLKEVVPPGVLRLVRPFRRPPSSPYGYFGDYSTFEAAVADCKTDGYATVGIVETVGRQTSELKERLRAGTASILQDARVMQNLAATALALATTADRPVSVLDFGGALGLHYLQLRPFLSGRSVSWVVCETVPMAEEGTKRFASAELAFISSLDDARGPFDLLISSGAIQCLPDPVATLAQHAALSDQLLFNRLPLIPSERNRLTIHRVDPAIYAADIPIWFFSERLWLAKLEELGFEITLRWEVPQDVLLLDGVPLILQGLLARRRRGGARARAQPVG